MNNSNFDDPRELTGEDIIPNYSFLSYADEFDKEILKEIKRYGLISENFTEEVNELKANLKFTNQFNVFAGENGADNKFFVDRVKEIFTKRKMLTNFKSWEKHIFKNTFMWIEIDKDPISDIPIFIPWFKATEFRDPLTKILLSVELEGEFNYFSGNGNEKLKVVKKITPEKWEFKYSEFDNENKKFKAIAKDSTFSKFKQRTQKNPFGFINCLKYYFEKTPSGGTTSLLVKANNYRAAVDRTWLKYQFTVEHMDEKVRKSSAFGRSTDGSLANELRKQILNDTSTFPSELSLIPLDANAKEIMEKRFSFALFRYAEFLGGRNNATNKGGTNKHNLEIETDYQNQTIKMNNEATLRNEQLTELLAMLVKIDSVLKKLTTEKTKFYIQIAPLNIKDDFALWENLISRYNAGLISAEKAIKVGDRISLSEAQEEVEKINFERNPKTQGVENGSDQNLG